VAARGPAVALRDIAEDAGVNFGLIYQYVGTKEQLLAEVYRQATEAAATRLADADTVDEALRRLLSMGDGTTARLIAWSALYGTRIDAFADSPALRVLADLVRAEQGVDAEDAQVFAALSMVMALGWRLFGGTALYAAGLDGARPERYDEHVRAFLDSLAGT